MDSSSFVPQPDLDKPIYSFGLPHNIVRSITRLIDSGALPPDVSLKYLSGMTEKEFLSMPGMGRQTLAVIKAELAKHRAGFLAGPA